MPSLYNSTPGADLDQQDQTAATAPYSGAERLGAAFGSFDFTQGIGHYGAGLFRDYGTDPMVSPDVLNEKYAVPGYLRFNKPKDEYNAAFEQHMALERQHRDQVFSRSNPSPLTDFAAGLAGSLLDPAALATMVATGGLGDAAMGVVGLERVAEAAPAVTTLGKIANAARVPLEGAIDNVPFVGLNAALSTGEGDDYDMGDALRDIAAGAVLHTSAHVAFRALPGLFRRGGAAADPEAPADPLSADTRPEGPALQPDPAPAAGVPPEVDALTPEARQGAFVKAVEDMAADRPVDVAGHVQTELETRAAEAEAEVGPGSLAERRAAIDADLAQRGLDLGEEWRAANAATDGTREARLAEYEARSAAYNREVDRANFDDLYGPQDEPAVTPKKEPANEAATILADTNRRFAAGDAGDLETLRPPGRDVSGPAVDTGEAGRAGAGGDRAGAGDGGGDRADPAAAPARPSAERLIAGDPELKALAAETDRYAADHGVTPAEPPPAQHPKTLADALHAAAVCLIGELG